MGETQRTVRRLPPHPASVGEARRTVRRLLAEHGPADLLEQGQLLISELVTHALVHSCTPIDLALVLTEDSLRVEVGDGSHQHPRPRPVASTTRSGAGLTVVAETADAWGVLPSIRGQTVWFLLVSGNPAAGPQTHVDTGAATPVAHG
ncbi:MAG: ATP-binding protein [Nocardioidaceae bacterium]